MTLSVYHVFGTTDGERASIGVCADGKTEAVRIVRERVLADGYAKFVHEKTERICAAGQWWPGTTVRYY